MVFGSTPNCSSTTQPKGFIMNIKTYIALAVTALTAACSSPEPAVEPSEAATEAVELADDGTPKANETVAPE